MKMIGFHHATIAARIASRLALAPLKARGLTGSSWLVGDRCQSHGGKRAGDFGRRYDAA